MKTTSPVNSNPSTVPFKFRTDFTQNLINTLVPKKEKSTNKIRTFCNDANRTSRPDQRFLSHSGSGADHLLVFWVELLSLLVWRFFVPSGCRLQLKAVLELLLGRFLRSFLYGDTLDSRWPFCSCEPWVIAFFGEAADFFLDRSNTLSPSFNFVHERPSSCLVRRGAQDAQPLFWPHIKNGKCATVSM